ncbi:General secretion pathway protein G [Rubrivivax sp. A210]|uniref:type II secretion system protein n=1 Tax=Rubrivivax sp. A210 TaxID=2772301 RepID=UPI001919ABA8|nr:type II secretion system protein [Rubrivivax sp. A210]CAD5373343.1 General secretion pathway protein G [Rubrivivax sp. A210]
MNRRRPLRPRVRGFTLMELVVTLALLGLMALLAAPLAELSVQRSREQELRAALREIRIAIDRYRLAADQGLIERKLGDSGYPPDLETLVKGVPNQKSPKREALVFLRRVPRDPLALPDIEPAAATWGLRSYASSAEAPMSGADVFDVYSRAEGEGMNGLPYRDW